MQKFRSFIHFFAPCASISSKLVSLDVVVSRKSIYQRQGHSRVTLIDIFLLNTEDCIGLENLQSLENISRLESLDYRDREYAIIILCYILFWFGYQYRVQGGLQSAYLRKLR